jgi:hypothetical protein
VRGSVELASAVDVERSSLFSRQWIKEVGLIVTKMVASVRNKGKL